MRNETYGLGGYDPKKKDGNVVSVVEVPDEVAPLSAEEKVAELAALLVEKGVATEAEVASKLERSEVAEVKPR